MDRLELASQTHSMLYEAIAELSADNNQAFNIVSNALSSADLAQRQKFLALLSRPDGGVSHYDTLQGWGLRHIYRVTNNYISSDILVYNSPLDNDHQTERKNGTSVSSLLGMPCRMPTEIIQLVLFEHPDLAGLTTLRSTSRALQSFIDTIPKYKALMKYGAPAVRGALSLEIAAHFSCGDLYNQLVDNTCGACLDLCLRIGPPSFKISWSNTSTRRTFPTTMACRRKSSFDCYAISSAMRCEIRTRSRKSRER